MSDTARTTAPETNTIEAAPTLPLLPPNREEQRRELAAEAFDANRTALFDALAAAGIADITVEFDGEGDQGQIEDVTAQDASGIVALPDVRIEVLTPAYDGSGMDRTDGDHR